MADDPVDPPWLPTTPANWSANVLASCGGWKATETKYLLAGNCPNCNHPGGIDAWSPKRTVEAGFTLVDAAVSFIALSDEPTKGDKAVPIECKCPFTHKAAPPSVHGCGAWGLVHLAIPKTS